MIKVSVIKLFAAETVFKFEPTGNDMMLLSPSLSARNVTPMRGFTATEVPVVVNNHPSRSPGTTEILSDVSEFDRFVSEIVVVNVVVASFFVNVTVMEFPAPGAVVTVKYRSFIVPFALIMEAPAYVPVWLDDMPNML